MNINHCIDNKKNILQSKIKERASADRSACQTSSNSACKRIAELINTWTGSTNGRRTDLLQKCIIYEKNLSIYKGTINNTVILIFFDI